MQTTPTYDAAGRLTALLHARGTTVLAYYAYTRDAAGNRTHVTETVGGVPRGISYTYDSLYRNHQQSPPRSAARSGIPVPGTST